MKKRQWEILKILFLSKENSINTLVDIFKVSQRTIYYDLEVINQNLKNIAKIEAINKKLIIVGDKEKIGKKIEEYNLNFNNIYDEIIYKILSEDIFNLKMLRLDDFENDRNVFNKIKKQALKDNVKIVYEDKYKVFGNEKDIRGLFLQLVVQDRKLLDAVDKNVILFNHESKLMLSDYSLAILNKFVSFIKKRNSDNFYIKSQKHFVEAKTFNHYFLVDKFFSLKNEDEISYLTLFVATLAGFKEKRNEFIINEFVKRLVDDFQATSAMILERKQEFIENLTKHLCSSFYRIKYGFPCYNPQLLKIKTKYKYLFDLIGGIIRGSEFREFRNIRQEELGYITMYFGAYLDIGKSKNKVIVVCPNGTITSKTLEVQLKTYIPTIEILDCISIYQLDDYEKEYDYIVSTISLNNKDNVIVVNPILNKYDISLLISKTTNIKQQSINTCFNRLFRIIEKHTNIINKKELELEILNFLLNENREERKEYMLKELLTRKRMQKVERCKDWKQAINLCAKPLLDDGSIEESYVDEMIKSVEKYGPYIVLSKGFAMPHAQFGKGVNQVAMSLLYLSNPVDLLGKEINLFICLASTDNQKHINALSELTTMMYDEAKFMVFMSGDLEKINEMINEERKEEA